MGESNANTDTGQTKLEKLAMIQLQMAVINGEPWAIKQVLEANTTNHDEPMDEQYL